MPVYRKKPLEVEAIQWTGGDLADIERFVKPCHLFFDSEGVKIRTLQGAMRITPGDFVIRGIAGECYPCKPDIFAATYELAAPEQQPDAIGDGS